MVAKAQILYPSFIPNPRELESWEDVMWGYILGKGGGRRKEAEEGGGRIGEGGVKDGLRRVGEEVGTMLSQHLRAKLSRRV